MNICRLLLLLAGTQAVYSQTPGPAEPAAAYDITSVKQVETLDTRARLDLDAYGGSKTVRGNATGWFTVQKINDRWYLVTPEGHGMVSLGVVHVLQGKEQPIFQAAYNSDSGRYIKDAAENLRRWGFNSMGYGGINKRSTPAMTQEMPFVLSMEDLLGISRFSRQPERIDLFADSARKLLAGRIAENIAPVKASKNLIGYFYVDVPLWWNLTVRKQGNAHPSQWRWCGWDELTGRRERYRIVDVERLLYALDLRDSGAFHAAYEEAVRQAIASHQVRREPLWTESLAVGTQAFVSAAASAFMKRHQFTDEHSQADGDTDTWTVREREIPYVTRLLRKKTG